MTDPPMGCPMPFLHALILCLFVFGCAAENQLLMKEGGQRAAEVDLWSKAVDLAGKNLRWVAGKSTDRMEVKDGDGKVEQSQVFFRERKPAPDGGVVSELVRATKNGEDVTEARRKDEEEQKKRQKEAKSRPDPPLAKNEKKEMTIRLYNEHPFYPDDQKSVSVEQTAETRDIQGRRCLGYRFRFDHGGDAFTSGMAWLEAETGVPLEVRFIQRPLPPHAKDLVTTIHFEDSPAGAWRTKESKSESKATFLFWTKYIINTQEFSDYWLRKD